MNKQEQREITENLLNNMTETILKEVDKFPNNWDGRQIRQYITDYATNNITFIKMDVGQKRNYNNDIRLSNLR